MGTDQTAQKMTSLWHGQFSISIHHEEQPCNLFAYYVFFDLNHLVWRIVVGPTNSNSSQDDLFKG